MNTDDEANACICSSSCFFSFSVFINMTFIKLETIFKVQRDVLCGCSKRDIEQIVYGKKNLNQNVWHHNLCVRWKCWTSGFLHTNLSDLVIDRFFDGSRIHKFINIINMKLRKNWICLLCEVEKYSHAINNGEYLLKSFIILSWCGVWC